jgi:hypothetical protein
MEEDIYRVQQLDFQRGPVGRNKLFFSHRKFKNSTARRGGNPVAQNYVEKLVNENVGFLESRFKT